MDVTREDVAKKAGVSAATVSNVINKKDIVSDKLKNRVLDAIEELGYRPNMIARSLKMNKTMQIALISNDITNQYYAEIALGMEEKARKAGYVVSMINANNKVYVDELLERQYDGVIMMTEKVSIDKINSLVHRNVPVIFIGNEGYKGLDKEVTEVHLDIYNGAYRLFKYLIENGHQRIGFFCSRVLHDLEEPDFRLRAYLDILEEFKITFDLDLIFYSGDTLEYIYNTTKRLLAYEERPTAIFTGNDNFAVSVMAAVRETGLTIPGDISIAGFDNLKASKYFSPPLTTVHMPKYKLGQKAMQMLLRKMNGEEVEDVMMATDLIVRDSVACVE